MLLDEFPRSSKVKLPVFGIALECLFWGQRENRIECGLRHGHGHGHGHAYLDQQKRQHCREHANKFNRAPVTVDAFSKFGHGFEVEFDSCLVHGDTILVGVTLKDGSMRHHCMKEVRLPDHAIVQGNCGIPEPRVLHVMGRSEHWHHVGDVVVEEICMFRSDQVQPGRVLKGQRKRFLVVFDCHGRHPALVVNLGFDDIGVGLNVGNHNRSLELKVRWRLLCRPS